MSSMSILSDHKMFISIILDMHLVFCKDKLLICMLSNSIPTVVVNNDNVVNNLLSRLQVDSLDALN